VVPRSCRCFIRRLSNCSTTVEEAERKGYSSKTYAHNDYRVYLAQEHLASIDWYILFYISCPHTVSAQKYAVSSGSLGLLTLSVLWSWPGAPSYRTKMSYLRQVGVPQKSFKSPRCKVEVAFRSFQGPVHGIIIFR
jgi:hypothetical protein